MNSLLALCKKHKLVLVEDAAHAHGSKWAGKKIGNVGHTACFSMQGIDRGKSGRQCGFNGGMDRGGRRID
ncbi:MAG: DegT/DnrJ/EryC1/StrS family aminotransferase [Verrucomicrobia bacterium]|nr:DegT/DnrJ/EryC1/StrS family aminotransferase [Verrucomicrobiota bacterium]MBU4248336.1 DegT/DnrJ/EryC1/StrS family aminotransferase [Verrucomicrobiota bacterium]MBU4291845.1 DegT/DnrJ/EryC1/StrS family aminotransferase [Verrucomicrobiota bacterium]MBU4496674.1 DegT/DnrJ/EryC1/StrS family aminotransferase [Verrucomicrobiota bacterium]